jgi:hypothetical protein
MEVSSDKLANKLVYHAFLKTRTNILHPGKVLLNLYTKLKIFFVVYLRLFVLHSLCFVDLLKSINLLFYYLYSIIINQV